MKLNFLKDILPHVLAVGLFFFVTVAFFSPIFFENKGLSQYDIQQHLGASKALRDYREATGEEGLWAGTMFSGMPAYLVNVQWSDGVVVGMKKVMSLFLPHPVGNIFLSFLCYYIMLLSFRVRPYFAMAGAVAFGLSSFLIIGLVAGHNSRVGAIAFMPLVMAGIHLTFSGKRLLGFAVTALAMAFHLREQHLQMTYYLIIAVAGYGLMQLVLAVRAKQLREFGINLLLLIPAVLLAVGSFFGQFWAISEYGSYSMRGPSELNSAKGSDSDGLPKSYVFEFSNGFSEPLTLMIPNILGGASSNYLFQNEQSASYQALVNSGNNELANQLAPYTSAYWGPQRLAAPYYAGAVICLLAALGILFAERKYAWWLGAVGGLGIALSWGSTFPALNYFLFDYFPGYNMFRSVTFALILPLMALPLLAAMGLETVLGSELTPTRQRKLLWALVVPGFCLILAVTGGFGSFLKASEVDLPVWFKTALRNDRMDLLQSDAWRSFWFTVLPFLLVFATCKKWVRTNILTWSLLALVLLDITLVDRRYLTKDNYSRKRSTAHALTEASQEILRDPGYYRVYDLQGFMNDASASYYHNSIGGYHGAKLRRYQDLVDSCVSKETQEMIDGLRRGTGDFSTLGVLNMLNVKYVTYGGEAASVIPNEMANGAAWFVKEVKLVSNPSEELAAVCDMDTRNIAVIDQSKFKLASPIVYDSTASLKLTAQKPNVMTYEVSSPGSGLAVFSEIYYEKGWHAFIDGKEVPLLRANYVLRALEIPANSKLVEMRFEPKPYMVGNKVTMAASWVLLLVVLGGLGWSVRTHKP